MVLVANLRVNSSLLHMPLSKPAGSWLRAFFGTAIKPQVYRRGREDERRREGEKGSK
jgi:hypothetical protein